MAEEKEHEEYTIGMIVSFIGASLALSLAVSIILYCFVGYPATFLGMHYVEIGIWIMVYTTLYHICKKINRTIVTYALVSCVMLIHAGYMLVINNVEINQEKYIELKSIDAHMELDALILFNRFLKDGKITIAEYRAVQNKR